MVWFVDHENNNIDLEPYEMNPHHNRLAIQKLAAYEDAEEQGLLPKFHLGDEFWTICLGKVLKSKIVMIQQKKDGTWQYRFSQEHNPTYHTTHDYKESHHGKFFFNTKEEAELAL